MGEGKEEEEEEAVNDLMGECSQIARKECKSKHAWQNGKTHSLRTVQTT